MSSDAQVDPGVRRPVLAIIADDLTGALDAAAPFAGRGLKVVVALGSEALPQAMAQGCDVVAVTTNSREISAFQARRAVAQAVAALPDLRILKKVDSRLKGNIAAELDALLYNSALVAPAIPDFGRIVQNGHVTGFGVDHPIDVRAVLGNHSGRAEVPDIASVEEMAAVVAASEADLLIGARGLADALAAAMTGRPLDFVVSLPGPNGLFVIGSRDPITLRQAAALRASPPIAFVPAANGQLSSCLPHADRVLLQAMPGETEIAGEAVAANLADAVIPNLQDGFGTALLCGGATAEAVLRRMGVRFLHICGECLPGLVVSATDGLTILTKSGGFGTDDSLVKVERMIGRNAA